VNSDCDDEDQLPKCGNRLYQEVLGTVAQDGKYGSQVSGKETGDDDRGRISIEHFTYIINLFYSFIFKQTKHENS